MWNKYSKLEKIFLSKYNNNLNYILMDDAEHFIWKKQEFSDIIINKINNIIK